MDAPDARALDKFYTAPHVVDACIETLGALYAWDTWDLVVEPSAGAGAFYTKIPVARKVGMDVAPDHADVETRDFFEYTPPGEGSRNVLVVGNPPFGRGGALAVRFFVHASAWARVIAFVIPRTFRRPSVQNRLSERFRLVSDTDVPACAASFSPPIAAKCCFQVWERMDAGAPPRARVVLHTQHADWDFLPFGALDARGQPTPPTGAHFAVRAYGGRVGEIRMTGLEQLRPKSWHWVRANIAAPELAARFAALDYVSATNTVRQNSLGRGELVRLYEGALGGLRPPILENVNVQV